ncbi:DUF4401 domain-containing protein [Aeromonas veronii]|uniref:DUF4401 domain-containing protein n=1 Tax=Aeromonas veronii TaxID=654 RepID=UPI003F79D273
MSDLTLWQALQQANLVEGEMPRNNQPHWSSRFLLGLVGWIAALFLLFFLFLTFEQLTREANSALLLGAVLLAGAYALNRSQSGDLWDQFVLALTLAADAWLLYGLLDQLDLHHALLWFGLCLLSLAIAVLFDHWLVRLFHSVAAALLLTLGLACLGLQLLALPLVMAAITFCWLRAGRDPNATSSTTPSRWGWLSPCWCWVVCTTRCGMAAAACWTNWGCLACRSGSIR